MDKNVAVFVDRDDTLMVDVGYCRNPDQVQLLPGVADGLKLLSQHGYYAIVVTNQSGIARGYFSPRELEAVHSRLLKELNTHGADLRAIYYCPHHPEESCSCRKPRPGLLLRAASELNLKLRSCYTIGDREWDIEAGRAAGTQTILLSNNAKLGGQPDKLKTQADYVAQDLLEAVLLILKLNPERKNSL